MGPNPQIRGMCRSHTSDSLHGFGPKTGFQGSKTGVPGPAQGPEIGPILGPILGPFLSLYVGNRAQNRGPDLGPTPDLDPYPGPKACLHFYGNRHAILGVWGPKPYPVFGHFRVRVLRPISHICGIKPGPNPYPLGEG